MKLIKLIAVVLSLFLFFLVAGLTFIALTIDGLLGSAIKYISRRK
jgi:hypothetical protein